LVGLAQPAPHHHLRRLLRSVALKQSTLKSPIGLSDEDLRHGRPKIRLVVETGGIITPGSWILRIAKEEHQPSDADSGTDA
jgi:hypothetical protein